MTSTDCHWLLPHAVFCLSGSTPQNDRLIDLCLFQPTLQATLQACNKNNDDDNNIGNALQKCFCLLH